MVQAKAGLKFNVRPDSGPLMELQQHMLFNEHQIMGEALEGLAIQVGSVQVPHVMYLPASKTLHTGRINHRCINSY